MPNFSKGKRKNSCGKYIEQVNFDANHYEWII